MIYSKQASQLLVSHPDYISHRRTLTQFRSLLSTNFCYDDRKFSHVIVRTYFCYSPHTYPNRLCKHFVIFLFNLYVVPNTILVFFIRLLYGSSPYFLYQSKLGKFLVKTALNIHVCYLSSVSIGIQPTRRTKCCFFQYFYYYLLTGILLNRYND